MGRVERIEFNLPRFSICREKTSQALCKGDFSFRILFLKKAKQDPPVDLPALLKGDM
jgi:hypothetical protein